MKKIAVLTLSLLLVACGGPKYKTVHGETVDFHALGGKWIVLNYWSTWCTSCKAEIPELNILHQNYHKQHIMVLAVNYDHLARRKLLSKIKSFNITYPVLQGDPAGDLNISQIPGLPVSFIINPKGKVVKTLFGMHTASQIVATVNALRNA